MLGASQSRGASSTGSLGGGGVVGGNISTFILTLQHRSNKVHTAAWDSPVGG